MKSYTDLGQSKKLAEYLPLDSADMYYHKNTKGDFVEYPHFNAEYKSMVDRDINYNDEVIPCWSLAALLELMLNDTTLLHFDNVFSMVHDNNKPYYITEEYNEPLDACYEMIIYLHELKML